MEVRRGGGEARPRAGEVDARRACWCALLLVFLLLLASDWEEPEVGPPFAVGAWAVRRGACRGNGTVRVVCLGDTHRRHAGLAVPEGDILIFAGDATDPAAPEDNAAQLRAFDAWLGALPHEHKVWVAGNHDPERGVALRDLPHHVPSATYLEDSAASLTVGARCGDGAAVQVSVFGSPWQPQWEGSPRSPTFVPEGEELARRFAAIPASLHVLATHSPPRGAFDTFDGEHIGSTSLRDAVERARPQLHCFGHVHPGRTGDMMTSQQQAWQRATAARLRGAPADMTLFVNGAVVNNSLVRIWEPVVVDIQV